MSFEPLNRSPGERQEFEEVRRLRQRPDNEVPGAVGREVLLVRTGEVAVFVSSMRAYRNGVDFTLEVRTRGGGDLDVLHGDVADRILFGFEFSNGRSCTLHTGTRGAGLRSSDQPTLGCGGASAGGRSADLEMFLSPLPPPGKLRIVCAWPARAIQETTTVIPAEEITEAAGRAQELWPWEPEPEPPTARCVPRYPKKDGSPPTCPPITTNQKDPPNPACDNAPSTTTPSTCTATALRALSLGWRTDHGRTHHHPVHRRSATRH